MNTFRKIGDQWVVVSHAQHEPGSQVAVTLRSGASKQVKLAALVGTGTDYQGCTVYHYATAPREQQTRPVANVGSLSGIMALFETAKAHLKFPAITLSVPACNETIKVSLAGSQAKVPGSLNVVSMTQEDQPFRGGHSRKHWYGRVHRDGRYEQADAVPAIAERLAQFAADPVGVASEHGRLTGRCCFCNTALSDERSTAVGYGATCADHFGLPWGERPKQFGTAA